jgi:UDP-N-acetyl-D-galactosamine dehydrogenase
MKIAVIGLGYVGLPLLLELSKYYKVCGFDINSERIKQLSSGSDITNEVKTNVLKRNKVQLFSNFSKLKKNNVFIICVPTPVKNKTPDIKSLLEATKTISLNLKKGDLVIYESTVYPGLTREKCLPILEKISKLKVNKDFFIGYSPERINPGKNSKKISFIKKIVSGSCPKALKKVSAIYSKIIKVGLFKASSIEVAEAAKIIENTQRDLNIALINEFSKILSKMNISTKEVLDAASTKWNFIKFQPGLVGGHCIGVDPYYLAYKAKKLGITPKVILAGRSTNDKMKEYVIKIIEERINKLEKKTVLVLGATFKEDCLDFRNSQTIKMVKILSKKTKCVDVVDKYFDKKISTKNITYSNKNYNKKYDIIIIAVAHDYIKKYSINKINTYLRPKGLILDLKSVFLPSEVDFQL